MQPEKQSLLILTPGFPRDEEDTACLPPQQVFVRELKENFPSLNIIVLTFQYPFMRSDYSWHGIRVISFNGKNRGRLYRIMLWIKVWRKMLQLIRENAIIGLFSFWCTECALTGKYFAWRYRLKHYTWILGQDAKKENRYIRFIRPRSYELVAMSDFLADEFYRNHRIRPRHVITNGIDPHLFTKIAVDRNIDILGAGSLIPLKRYDLFLHIVHDLKRSFPGIRAVITGNGPEQRRLELLADDLELTHEVLLTGEKPHYEVLKLMQRTRIFLHTSLYEGFSTVCLEALYGGAHVVSFCKPMHKSLLHWHVVNTEQEMRQKVADLLASAQLNHEPSLSYTMSDSARAVMGLFT